MAFNNSNDDNNNNKSYIYNSSDAQSVSWQTGTIPERGESKSEEGAIIPDLEQAQTHESAVTEGILSTNLSLGTSTVWGAATTQAGINSTVSSDQIDFRYRKRNDDEARLFFFVITALVILGVIGSIVASIIKHTR